MSSKELGAIWTVMVKWITSSLRQVVNSETQSDEKEHEMKVVGILANMAILTITNMSSNEPVNLRSAIRAMNETLDAITNKKTGTQICDMCEKYWKLHPELELDLSINVVRWLLKQASQPNATVRAIIK